MTTCCEYHSGGRKRRLPQTKPLVRKRPSYLTSWEDSFRRGVTRDDASIANPKHHRFGLMDLFGVNRWVRPKDDRPSGFFTLRIEHRNGGTVAKHDGEERFLLFRSDRAGAIAKVVFSSSPTHHSEIATEQHTKVAILAHAKVHVLFVKDAYRGFHLGGFLFALCQTHLREHYGSTLRAHGGASVRCTLDAEEDIQRHDKLVHFYERLGFRRRARTTTFLHNNDGETYRVVPMKTDWLLSPPLAESAASGSNSGSAYASFLPAILNSACGERARLDNRRIDSWLIVECDDGNIQLRTTDGRILQLDEKGGKCRLVPADSRATTNSKHCETFQLLKVSDVLDKVLSDKEEQSCKYYDGIVTEKELWMIRSSWYGSFLGLTHDHTLVVSEEPLFWQADENFCLVHTFDSPGRRQHHRRMWRKQGVEYVTRMRERYSIFDKHTMTIEEALDLTGNLQANPFSMSPTLSETETHPALASSSSPSFRTSLFHTAELARQEGHPDWVQFVALIHGLASALTYLDDNNSDDNNDDDFDWTIYVDSRVMGCKASKTSSFAEFRYLNPDKKDERYKTTTGLYPQRIGLEHVLLSWTSSEYMYRMLKHNKVRLPNEAYAILRLFPLVDWHSRGEHAVLSNSEEEELKLFVAEFYDLKQRSEERMIRGGTLTESECNELWTNHYSLIANKYGAGDILQW